MKISVILFKNLHYQVVPGSGGIDPYILSLRTRWRRMVNSMSQPLFSAWGPGLRIGVDSGWDPRVGLNISQKTGWICCPCR